MLSTDTGLDAPSHVGLDAPSHVGKAPAEPIRPAVLTTNHQPRPHPHRGVLLR
ncbi:hypothetical protein ACFYVL_07865 [Streptomyces sp. NPDC004111]|uniref:hypothetical protein n=1 Tax=Streptomyces sp. NPDC004111 TaxID=3364690 RepID=UPI0036CC24C1